jgi:hypothetical protein
MSVLSVCPTASSPLNAWTNRYETRYVYHGTWAHLNGGLHKSLPSVCVSVCVSPLELLGNGSVYTFLLQRINYKRIGGVVFYAVRVQELLLVLILSLILFLRFLSLVLLVYLPVFLLSLFLFLLHIYIWDCLWLRVLSDYVCMLCRSLTLMEFSFHCATRRKVAGSNPDVIGFFNWPNPSSCTVSLGSTQPLTEMSTRNLPQE